MVLGEFGELDLDLEVGTKYAAEFLCMDKVTVRQRADEGYILHTRTISGQHSRKFTVRNLIAYREATYS